jgi:Tfp pilus assembly protein PilF
MGCDGLPGDHDTLYKRGIDLIDPYMKLADRGIARSEDRDVHLRAGIACLDRVLALAPKNWSAFWVRGKALQTLGEHVRSANSFASAYKIQPDNPDVGREYVLELLETKAFPEAVNVSSKLSGDNPTNAGLLANLALALLLNHELQRAAKAIEAALALDPNDPVTKALKHRIEEVASGRRKQPQSLQELEGAG